MYNRTLTDTIEKRIGKGKAILLVGPRQVGKTTLLKRLLEGKDYLFIDADDHTLRSLFTSPNTKQIQSILGHYKFVFIDEAQRIPNIGLTLKIITDQFKDVQLLVSGSSSFDLTNALNEPLTGRKWEYQLLPISWREYEDKEGYLESELMLENRLLYGFYPDVINNPSDEKEILKELVSSYLYRDLLTFSGIRKPEILHKLVRALAFQIGSEVNMNELAQLVGVDRNTIATYIDILEKGYVVFQVPSFSRNLRNEIKKYNKIYFYDIGIRNLVIGNFNPLAMRNDRGGLWENFLIAERIKMHTYKRSTTSCYFWRTKQQQEVDWVEDKAGDITGFEFKWKAKANAKLPITFTKAYNADTRIIDRDNFRDFVF